MVSFVFVLCLFFSVARAEREVEFAKGLQRLQLYDLCFEQFQKVLGGKYPDMKLDEDKKMEIELAFAKAYMDAADHTEDTELRDQYLDQAAKQYDAFLKAHPDAPEINEVRYDKAMLQQSRAVERSNQLKRMHDKKKAAAIVKKGVALFADAASQFENAAGKSEAAMEKISTIARDKRLIARRQVLMEMFLKSINQAAWTHYYWAEMYGREVVSDVKKQKAQLNESLKRFKKYVDDYGNFVIALSGRIGRAACFEQLGDIEVKAKRNPNALKQYEETINELIRVTQKRPNSEANPFRFHAYYLLGQVYKKMGRLDPAKGYFNMGIKQVNILIEQVPENIIFEEPTDNRMQQTQLTVKKAMLEKGECFLELAKRATGKLRNDSLKKGQKAIADVIKAGGPMSRIATELLNKWKKVFPAIKIEKSVIELIADAQKRFDKAEKAFVDPKTRAKSFGLYGAAIRAYQNVIVKADPDEEAPMIGEAWQQIGLCYFKQGRYFEAALAFGKVPDVLPDHPKGADISFASTQLLGHVLDQEHTDEVIKKDGTIVRGKIISDKPGESVKVDVPGEKQPEVIPQEEIKRKVKDAPLDHMMDIYVDSLKKFARKFPDDTRATEAVFRSADALRAGGRFKDAAQLYESIPTHATEYEKACYLSGHCFWAAYLATVAADATKTKEAAPLWQRAVQKLTNYLKWAAEQPEISPEYTQLKRYWMAKSRLRLASIYSYEGVGEYQKALDILKGFEDVYQKEILPQGHAFHKEAESLQKQIAPLEKQVAALKKGRQDAQQLANQLQVAKIRFEDLVGTLKEINEMPAEIHTCRIKSYCGLGRFDEAKAEYADLEKKYPNMDPLEKSKLSRLLAMGYLNQVKNLKEKGVSADKLKEAQDKAAQYVMNVTSLNPNLTANDLVWYGRQLFEIGHDEDAAKVFSLALAKLTNEGNKYTTQYWGVVTGIANAYEQAEKWKEARQWQEVLLAWEKVYILCGRRQEIAQKAFDDKKKLQTLLGLWEDRKSRGDWVICFLSGNGTYSATENVYKDSKLRAQTITAWDANKGAQKAIFEKFGLKPFDPRLIGVSSVLRKRLAFVTEKSGDYAKALPMWEALANDIQKGSPVWLDAKYHQVFCLLKTKQAKDAKRAMSSLLISYPQLGGKDRPELQKKFLDMMKKEFSKSDYEDLVKTREASLDEKKVAGELKKIDKETIDALRPKTGNK
ncbi:MAG: tetratricopeptide repeat protein [Planctomycetes bacterium]|nr:tetratricopeptide repeat protein [Planctomycetota bacterium]